MPAKSPEALARKAEKRKQKRLSAKAAVRYELQKSDLPRYKIAARNMLPRLMVTSKSELRAMLSQAMKNTEAMQCHQ
jgi:hypothetical protein